MEEIYFEGFRKKQSLAHPLWLELNFGEIAVEKKMEQSQKVYNKMAWEYDSSPEGNYTRPHKEEIMKKAVLRNGDNILDVACENGYLLGEL